MIKIPQTLAVSWKESLNLLKGRSLGLLLWLSLRSFFSLYTAIIYAWFLPTALLIGLVLNEKSLIYAFLVTLYVRATRPSIENKKVSYWQHLLIADWVLFFGLLALVYTPALLSSRVSSIDWYGLKLYELLIKLFFLGGHTWLPGAESLGVFTIFLSPFVIVWLLFMLDARMTVWQYIKAFGRAILMMIYNYPVFLIIYEVVRLGLSVCYLLGNYLCASCTWLSFIGWVVLLFIFLPFYVCFIANIYIKRLHEQFSLYYTK